MALHDKEQQEMDREDGMVRQRPAVLLLKHLHELWPADERFVPTKELLRRLVWEHPDDWGAGSPAGKELTAQRLGRMLVTSYGLNSRRLDRSGPRGYVRADLLPVWRRMGIATPAPDTASPPQRTGASGAGSASGADLDALY